MHSADRGNAELRVFRSEMSWKMKASVGYEEAFYVLDDKTLVYGQGDIGELHGPARDAIGYMAGRSLQ